jgi:hypothetical protein
MATEWKIQNKRFDSGPDWDALDTSGVDDWELLTEHYWEWTKTWTIITGTKGKLATET